MGAEGILTVVEVLRGTDRQWRHPLVSGLINIIHFLSTAFLKTIQGSHMRSLVPVKMSEKNN